MTEFRVDSARDSATAGPRSVLSAECRDAAETPRREVPRRPDTQMKNDGASVQDTAVGQRVQLCELVHQRRKLFRQPAIQGAGIELHGAVGTRGARRIAVESVVAGIGLSVMGMIAAAFGYLTTVQGALLQEVIDVAVILNALRALRIAPHEPTIPKPKAVSSGQDDIAQGATP